MVDRKAFTVYGAPSSELRKMLDQFSPQYFRPIWQFRILGLNRQPLVLFDCSQ
jgi:hypothetical protein